MNTVAPKQLPYVKSITSNELCTILEACVRDAYVAALPANSPDWPPNDFGNQLFSQVVYNATQRLRDFGLERADVGSQVRLTCQDDRYGRPFRVLLGKGVLKDGFRLKVNRKGAFSVRLIRENERWHPQLALFESATEVSEEGSEFQNFWLFWDTVNDWLRIYVTLPFTISRSGTVIGCIECETIYEGQPLKATPTAEDLPQEVPVSVVVHERTAEGP